MATSETKLVWTKKPMRIISAPNADNNASILFASACSFTSKGNTIFVYGDNLYIFKHVKMDDGNIEQVFAWRGAIQNIDLEIRTNEFRICFEVPTHPNNFVLVSKHVIYCLYRNESDNFCVKKYHRINELKNLSDIFITNDGKLFGVFTDYIVRADGTHIGYGTWVSRLSINPWRNCRKPKIKDEAEDRTLRLVSVINNSTKIAKFRCSGSQYMDKTGEIIIPSYYTNSRLRKGSFLRFDIHTLELKLCEHEFGPEYCPEIFPNGCKPLICPETGNVVLADAGKPIQLVNSTTYISHSINSRIRFLCNYSSHIISGNEPEQVLNYDRQNMYILDENTIIRGIYIYRRCCVSKMIDVILHRTNIYITEIISKFLVKEINVLQPKALKIR